MDPTTQSAITLKNVRISRVRGLESAFSASIYIDGKKGR